MRTSDPNEYDYHAIVVTASFEVDVEHRPSLHWIDVAYQKALEIFGDWKHLVTPPNTGGINDVRSFAILPDGSKPGWDVSNDLDALRLQFLDWMRAQCYRDLSSPLTWVEVGYGGDYDPPPRVTADYDSPLRELCPDGCAHPLAVHGSGGCGGVTGLCWCSKER